MHMRLEHLRERLLREGVAYRHVRRYVTELSDHYEDAFAAEKAKGLSHDAAAAAAWDRIGDTEELAMTALSRPELRSVYARFSPAIFGAGPLLAWIGVTIATMVAFALVATMIGSHEHKPMAEWLANLLQMLCFVYVRVLPIVIGIGMLALADKHRIAMIWPLLGAVAIAIGAGTSEIFIIPPTAERLGELEAGNALLSLIMSEPMIGAPDSLWLRPGFTVVLLNLVLILGPYTYWRRREAMA